MNKRQVIYPFLKSQRWYLIAALIWMGIDAVLSMLLPLFIGAYFGIRFSAGSGKTILLEMFGISIKQVDTFLWIFAGLILCKLVCALMHTWFLKRIESHWQMYLRETVLESILYSHSNQISPPSNLDFRALGQVITQGILRPIGDSLLILFAWILLYQMHAVSAIFILLAFCGAWLLAFLFSKLFSRRFALRQNAQRRIEVQLQEILEHLRVIQWRNKMGAALKRLSSKQRKEHHTIGSALFLDSAQKAVAQSLFFVVLWLLFFTQDQHFQPQDGSALVAFILILLYAQGAIKRMFRLPGVWHKANQGFANMTRRYLHVKRQTLDDRPRLKCTRLSWKIESDSLPSHWNSNELMRPYLLHLNGGNEEHRTTWINALMGFDIACDVIVKIDDTDLSRSEAIWRKKHFHFIHENLNALNFLDGPAQCSTMLEAIEWQCLEGEQSKKQIWIVHLASFKAKFPYTKDVEMKFVEASKTNIVILLE